MKTKYLDKIEWLYQLISFDTTSSHSNLPLIDAIQNWFSHFQISPRLTYHPDGTKANLLATLPASNGKLDGGLILSGHTDVVPVADQTWDSDPFIAVKKENRIHGRGACDMKGFLAVILALVPLLQEMDLNYPLHFAFSYDEEIGCKGVPLLIADLLQTSMQPSACIVGEPTQMRPVVAHKGIQVFCCLIHGLASHSSLITKGCNAIDYAAILISYIRRIAETFSQTGPFDDQYDVPFSTLSTNRINGGTALNIVPSLCEFFFEFRHLPEVDPQVVIEKINTFINHDLLKIMQKEYELAKVDFTNIANAPSFTSSATDSLLNLIQHISHTRPYKVAYATEAGLFQQANIQTVVWGPGSIEEAHKANEFITLQQLNKCENDLLAFIKAFNLR